MLLTVAQCLDMALEKDRLAALVLKQLLKTQHTDLAEIYRDRPVNTPSSTPTLNRNARERSSAIPARAEYADPRRPAIADSSLPAAGC